MKKMYIYNTATYAIRLSTISVEYFSVFMFPRGFLLNGVHIQSTFF